jgi:steroid delta-isomerase
VNFTDELARLVHFYETLSPATLPAQLGQIYAADASFKDPFNEVEGLAAIEQIFAHMFKQVIEPKFVVTTRVLQGAEAFLAWDFRFRMQRTPDKAECIRGASHIRFDGDGAVMMHRDYWDAAEELYEKLPVLGSLMRWLKRKARG